MRKICTVFSPVAVQRCKPITLSLCVVSVACPGGRAIARIAGSNPVVFCVGSGLCDGLITRTEESYRVCVCVMYKPQQWGPSWSVSPQNITVLLALPSAPQHPHPFCLGMVVSSFTLVILPLNETRPKHELILFYSSFSFFARELYRPTSKTVYPGMWS